jgi:hypothetical protein
MSSPAKAGDEVPRPPIGAARRLRDGLLRAWIRPVLFVAQQLPFATTAPSRRLPVRHSSTCCITTKTAGTNGTVRQVEASTPEDTVIPMDCRRQRHPRERPWPVPTSSRTARRAPEQQCQGEHHVCLMADQPLLIRHRGPCDPDASRQRARGDLFDEFHGLTGGDGLPSAGPPWPGSPAAAPTFGLPQSPERPVEAKEQRRSSPLPPRSMA